MQKVFLIGFIFLVFISLNAAEISIEISEKINVSLCKIVNKELIDLVVRERGAGKTLACGTAACAAAVAAVTNNHVSEKIQVRLPGGILDINYSKGKTVVMSGPTEINFNGEYKIN